jgi:hypothetical protein
MSNGFFFPYVNADIDMRPAPSLLWLGGAIILAVVAFYAVFW